MKLLISAKSGGERYYGDPREGLFGSNSVFLAPSVVFCFYSAEFSVSLVFRFYSAERTFWRASVLVHAGPVCVFAKAFFVFSYVDLSNAPLRHWPWGSAEPQGSVRSKTDRQRERR